MNFRPSQLKEKGAIYFSRFCSQKGIKVLSLDIFDTYLLRNIKPEIFRFREIACRHYCFFKELRIDFSINSLFAARLNAHKIGYRTAPMVHKFRDASLSHIFRIYLHHLNIRSSSELINQLIDIELKYEKDNLSLNKYIYNFALAFHQQGGRIFFISDMYFQKKHIAMLLAHFSDFMFYEDIYMSSQFSTPKSSGILFRHFLTTEGLVGNNILHIGDDLKSDIRIPQNSNFNTMYTPRSSVYCFLRRLLQFYYEKKYRPFLP